MEHELQMPNTIPVGTTAQATLTAATMVGVITAAIPTMEAIHRTTTGTTIPIQGNLGIAMTGTMIVTVSA